MKKRILLAVGGTGGHLFPAQALAKELLDRCPDLEIAFAGHKLGTTPYFDRESFSYYPIQSSTIKKKNLLNLSRGCLKLAKGSWQSLQLLRDLKPDLVVGFGSFHTFPVLLATRFMRIPYVLFEANAYIGKVNRFFVKNAHFCAMPFCYYNWEFPVPTHTVKMPLWCLREPFVPKQRDEACAYFGLQTTKPICLVFGGSQGAQFFNGPLATELATVDAQFIHLTGKEEVVDEVHTIYRRHGRRAVVKNFEERMELAWQVADMAIARAGASSVAESLHFGVPAIFIPFPAATDDHQTYNAKMLSDKGAAVLIRESKEAPAAIKTVVENFFAPDRQELKQMRAQLKAYEQSQERKNLSELILNQLQSMNLSH